MSTGQSFAMCVLVNDIAGWLLLLTPFPIIFLPYHHLPYCLHVLQCHIASFSALCLHNNAYFFPGLPWLTLVVGSSWSDSLSPAKTLDCVTSICMTLERFTHKAVNIHPFLRLNAIYQHGAGWSHLGLSPFTLDSSVVSLPFFWQWWKKCMFCTRLYW